MGEEPAPTISHAWDKRSVSQILDDRVVKQFRVVLLDNEPQFWCHATLTVQHSVRDAILNQTLKQRRVQMEGGIRETSNVALGRKLLVVPDKHKLFKCWKREEGRRDIGFSCLGGLFDEKNTGFCRGKESSIFGQAGGSAADHVNAMFVNNMQVAGPFVDFLLLCFHHGLINDSMKPVPDCFTKLRLENLVDTATE